MLIDSLPPEQRNILRYIFLDPQARAAQYNGEGASRFVLMGFRADTTRAGAAEEMVAPRTAARRTTVGTDLEEGLTGLGNEQVRFSLDLADRCIPLKINLTLSAG